MGRAVDGGVEHGGREGSAGGAGQRARACGREQDTGPALVAGGAAQRRGKLMARSQRWRVRFATGCGATGRAIMTSVDLTTASASSPRLSLSSSTASRVITAVSD